jgi:diguanylate cyclase (GGDEF)-like protein
MIAFLPETDCTNALLVGERLRKTVEKCRITLPGAPAAPPVSLTVSIGIACWPDVEAATPEELVQAADEALYQAKTQGRNRCAVALSGPAKDT